MSAENDSDLGSGRGYDRIGELGYHFLWGMGEGAYGRFEALTNREVHATFVNILVSYGVIGLLVYFWILLSPMAMKQQTVRNYACYSGVLLYFLTHNGVRNTILWMLLAIVMMAGERKTYAEPKPGRQTAL